MMAIAFFMYAGLEFQDIPRQPYLWLTIATVSLMITIWKTIKVLSRIKAMKQGRDGEKFIGQYLDNEFRDELTGNPIRVFHDIPGDNFNLDHVIICEKGIYILETKTLSVPIKGSEELLYRGGNDLYYKSNENKVPGNPIGQIMGNVKWFKNLLNEQYDQRGIPCPYLPIKGVLILPNRFIFNENIHLHDIWVLNHKALAKFVGKENNQLKSEIIKSSGDIIDNYIVHKLG